MDNQLTENNHLNHYWILSIQHHNFIFSNNLVDQRNNVYCFYHSDISIFIFFGNFYDYNNTFNHNFPTIVFFNFFFIKINFDY